MNAGLSNLAMLKAWLLPAAMRDGTDYDQDIRTIGLGVAAQLERALNRKLEYSADTTDIVTGGRESIVLMRYPVVAIASVETRVGVDDDWTLESDVIEHWNASSGVVRFAGALGHSELTQLRITYTGGYWWEQLEADDEGYPSEKPEGATEIDGDIRLAWLLQCEHVWGQRDKLGLKISERPSSTPALVQLALLPAVREHLQPHIRYAMT